MIGSTAKRPRLESVRRIKRTLSGALALPEDALVTVAQLACLEQGCAPLETVIGLLRAGEAQVQHKIHKPTDEIDANDLVEVCAAWGWSVETSALESIFKEN